MTIFKNCAIALVVGMCVQHSSFAKELIDLEKHTQDFVLEAKQIIIPGFPGAFNASFIRWQGSILMAFRVRDAKMVSTFQIGFVWLDEQFTPISKPQILQIIGDPSTFSQNQDPRLIIVNNELYILYSNFIQIGEKEARRMFLAQVQIAKEKFFIKNPVSLHPYENWSHRWEKNWVPFNFKENLLVAYSLTPHLIFKPSMSLGECTTVSSTTSVFNWNWGELRGGTPALLDGEEYIAFFHSSIDMESVHSKGKKIQHYFMGAYTFAAQPPFQITRVSPEPIVGKKFYHGPEYPTWKPVRVVFPMGLMIDSQYFWVSYGRQDFEIWVAKIDKKGLYNSLVPCAEVKKQCAVPRHEQLYNDEQVVIYDQMSCC